MEPAEDLVFITIIESYGPDSYETSSWTKEKDKIAATLQSAKTSTTFNVPTCMTHGSKSVRTLRTRFVAVAGFFVFFYPIVFFLLQINLALVYSRSLTEPIIGALLFIGLLLMTILYGLIPRALERGLKFENTSRTKDLVDVIISNKEYRKHFRAENEMFIETVGDSES
jgi:ATP/ADP translocase